MEIKKILYNIKENKKTHDLDSKGANDLTKNYASDTCVRLA